jgi:hypothetical protein
MSSETATQVAETPHGAIEYETVECTSCGNECLPEEAKDFVTGDGLRNTSVGARNRKALVFYLDDDPVQGIACPHCHDEGPMSFPERAREWALHGFGEDHTGASFWFAFALGPVLVPLIALLFLTEDNDNIHSEAVGFAHATWIIALWGAAIVAGWWFLL